MKIVKIKPFGVFKLSDQALDSVKNQTVQEGDQDKIFKEFKNRIKREKSAHFIGINEETKEMFSFIPIIEKGELFTSYFPDPIQLYYSLAYSSHQSSLQIKKNIVLQKQYRNLNFVSDYLYNWHLKQKICTIIFLHATIEAFINYSMPEEFIYRQEFEGGKSDKFFKQIKEYSKEQTERNILFKEKLKEVVIQLTGIDFQSSNKKTYDNLLNLNALRNDIIHLRSTKDKNQQHFHKVFDQIINIDLEPFINTVKEFVNIIKPDFILFEELELKEKDTINFNFQSHAAFKLDISVFLKIIKTPSNKILLNIPKGKDEEEFQFFLNWILQNLDLMAKEQMIYIATIKDNYADKLVIEIIKTGTDF